MPNQDDYELDPLNYGMNIAGGAASGAAAGSVIPGAGSLVGGIIGGGLGLAQSITQQNALNAEQARQQELDAELAKAGADYDAFAIGANLGLAQRGQQDELAARQTAARGNLTAGSAADLQQMAGQDSARIAAQQMPGLGLAAKQAQLLEQDAILQQYKTAQDLASGTDVNSDMLGSIGAIGGNMAELMAKQKAGWGQSSKTDVVPDPTVAPVAPTFDSNMANTLAQNMYPTSGQGAPAVDFNSPFGFNDISQFSMGQGASLPGLLGEPGAAAAFAPAALPPRLPDAALAPPSSPAQPAGWQPGVGLSGTGERGGAAGAAARAQAPTAERPDPASVAAGPDFTDVETFKQAFGGMADEATLTAMYNSPDFDKATAGTVYRSSQYVMKLLRYLPQTPEGAAQAMSDPTFLMALQNIDPTIKAAKVVVGPGGNLTVAQE